MFENLTLEIVYSSKQKELWPWAKIEFEKFNLNTHKEYLDRSYYKAYSKCYDRTIRATLTRMLNNEERRIKSNAKLN